MQSDAEKNSVSDKTSPQESTQVRLSNILKNPTKKTSSDEKHEKETCIEELK